MKSFFVLWHLFALFLFVFEPQTAGNQFVIQNLNEKYGLIKESVNCEFQDSKGFLWFGSVNGLYKFDLTGFNYLSLQQNTKSGFPESDVRTIFEYSPGLLLIGTYNKGLLIYNTLTESFDRPDCNSAIDFTKLSVNCVYGDKTGAIWIATSRGLLKLRYTGKQINKFKLCKQFDAKNTNLVSQEFFAITESKEGKVWFLTMSEICFYDESVHKIKTFPIFYSNSSFTFIDDKRLLIGCFGKGLKLFNTETLKFEDIQVKGITEKSQVTYVYKDKHSNIWLSLSNIGLMFLESGIQNTRPVLITNNELEYSDLNSNVILRINESNDGTIWVCSQEGINTISLKPKYFAFYKFRNPRQNSGRVMGVRSLLNSNNGFVWAGTIGGGLKQFNLANQKISDVTLTSKGTVIGKNIQTIMQDQKGDLWLGTEGEGVIRFRPDKSSGYLRGTTINYRIYPESFPSKTLLNDFIMCILEDRHKNIWIGTWYGLSFIDSSDVQKPDQSGIVIKNFINNPADSLSISNNIIMSLFEDEKGDIWVGTSKGLNKIIKTPEGFKFLHSYRNKSGAIPLEKKIMNIYQSKRGKLWFSSQDGGISLMDTNTGAYEKYNSESGSFSNVITSISEDSEERLWLGSNNGLYCFNQTDHSFKNYTKDDGLVSNDFLFASTCKVGDDIYFGVNEGITLFNPHEIAPVSFSPNLVFTDLKLFNKSVSVNDNKTPLKRPISLEKTIILEYNQNFITLSFAALNYKFQKEIHYSCMMEGIETSWNNLGKEHKATYTNMTPGRYIFRVKAFNVSDYNKASYISLEIIVKPPFWKTIWAYLVYLLLILFTIIQTYLFFLTREKRKNALALERLNAKKTHEIDIMRLRFFTNISHEFRTPLTLLSAPLETLIKEKPEPDKAHNYYQLMLRNVQRLTRLIDQLLDLRKVEEGFLKMEWAKGDIIEFVRKTFDTFQNYAEKRNMYFTFHSDLPVLNTYFDSDKLDKILFNLLSNAFKYTGDYGTIALKLSKNKPVKQHLSTAEYLEIKISDSGVGIPMDSLEMLFRPFHQVYKNKPIKSKGTGLGLSLTKELIELHKGLIFVESEVDKGSVFTVYLPIYEGNPHTEPEVPGISLPNEKIDGETCEPIEQKKNINDHGTLSKPLVLLVEDDPDLRSFVKGELEKNYRMIESENGEDGLEKAVQKIPDLVISDIMMEKMDGVELCRLLKTDERTCHIPVILLTAKHSQDAMLDSYETGADDYITKPFLPTLLHSRIKNLIEQRRRLRTLFSKEDLFTLKFIPTNNIDAKLFEKLSQIIEENTANPAFNPEMLASKMAMSRMQLYRKVSALTNQSVYDYIRTLRLNKAARLLLTTDMKIHEIALSVGYTEPSNFTKCFIRQFKQTPSQYVLTHRK